jgi:glutamate 5-kinase
VSRLQQRKQWILSLKTTGTVHVDAGATRALTEGKKSLLPSGIVKIDGQFAAGDCVKICDADGKERARGLIGFDADELAKIRGHKSTEIAALLGYKGPAEVVHRDDLVLV